MGLERVPDARIFLGQTRMFFKVRCDFFEIISVRDCVFFFFTILQKKVTLAYIIKLKKHLKTIFRLKCSFDTLFIFIFIDPYFKILTFWFPYFNFSIFWYPTSLQKT